MHESPLPLNHDEGPKNPPTAESQSPADGRSPTIPDEDAPTFGGGARAGRRAGTPSADALSRRHLAAGPPRRRARPGPPYRRSRRGDGARAAAAGGAGLRARRGGLLRLCVPRALGGPEAHPAVLLDAIETLAAADGAAGWCAMIGATERARQRLPARRRRARRSTAIAERDHRRRLRAARAAPWRRTAATASRALARSRAAASTAPGSWAAASCRATGGQPAARAHDALPGADVRDHRHLDRVRPARHRAATTSRSRDVFVPAARVGLARSTTGRVAAAPLYAFPVFGLLALGIAAVALGHRARAPSTSSSRSPARKTPTAAAADASPSARVVQAQVAEAEALARRRRARSCARPSSDAWEARRARRRASPSRERARAPARRDPRDGERPRAPSTSCTTPAAAPRSTPTSPLQRCFRDVHVVTQHVMVARADVRARRPRAPRPRHRHGACSDADGRLRRRSSSSASAHVLRVTIAHPTSELNAVDEALHHDLTRSSPGSGARTRRARVLLTGRGRAFSRGRRLRLVPAAARAGAHGGAPPRRQAAHLGPARRRDPDRRRGERPRDGPRRVDRARSAT